MKALILAAGLGTRLTPYTIDRPKCLVPVGGTPILVRQLDALAACGIKDVTVVTGYLGDKVEGVVSGRRGVRVVENRDYASTNNMYSAWMGTEGLAGEPFLMMNGDVCLDEGVVRSLLSFPFPNAVVVDRGCWMEESMKVVEEGGRLVAISKTIPEGDALGCSIDVYNFGEDGGRVFRERCRRHIQDANELGLWSEVALGEAFRDVEFRACPLGGRWLEVDSLEDLAEAEEVFS